MVLNCHGDYENEYNVPMYCPICGSRFEHCRRQSNFKRPITIQFDSDSSEADDETTDNFINEIGLKGEKEQIEDFVTLRHPPKSNI